ncbi:MAG: IS200/IS605 family accessory protein TnpB-related protein, partial [Desulfatiglandales bacterium]
AYQCLPATAAQQVVRDVADSFKAWAAALKAYAKNPAGFTGRPAMPGYLARHERSVVSLPWASLASGKLPGLTQRSLFLDFERAQSVSEEAKAALASLNLHEAVRALQARHRLDTARPLEVRLVPQSGHRTRIEVVFELTLDVQPKALVRRLDSAVSPSLKGSARDEALKAQLASLTPADFRHVAGADFGLNNLLTLAFGGGHPGLVVSGQRIERRLAHLDARLDAAIARHSSPELKALQSRKDRGERLSPAEMVQLRQHQKAVFEQPEVQRLRQERQQFLKSAVHRVTHGVVERLHAAGVHVLVVGQNKGWKNGAHQTQDKGRTFNRRAHRIPHQLLLEQLRYKLHERGMLLVTTEESYTSKTSFALNEPLEAHASVATPAKTASAETSEART